MARPREELMAPGGEDQPAESHIASAAEPVSVVIPAYNEEASVEQVAVQVQQVLNGLAIPHEVIIVDDGSTDGTSAAAARSGARVIRHQRNRGYGASLKTGILAARYDAIVITDADGTYPINRIPELLLTLREADLVIGARVNQNVKIPLTRRPAKWILRRLAEYVAGESIPDLNSGLRAFRRSAMEPYFPILPSRFSFTTTQTLAMLCDQYRVATVSIDYYRREGKSKIVPWDFMTFVSLVLRVSMLFNPLKVFVPPALVCLALGGLKLVLDVVFAIMRAGGLSWAILLTPTISTSALILVLAGIQMLLIGMMSDAVARKMGQPAATPGLSGFAARPGSRVAADAPDRSGSGR
jgi:glycosyltransferase involved in cell wall biosynthesis